MTMTSELAAALKRLDALTDWERRSRKFMRVGLEPMRDISRRLGDPQTAFRVVHVAGTKGKGSVSALIEAGLVRAGLKVGRYASPHVERINERVTLAGREIDDATLARALTRALDAYEAARRNNTSGAEATWFDLLTAAAFLIFRDAGLQWAVIEVGLGGRLDSTNVTSGEVAVVTNIGLEHTETLGNTRAAIAAEKAGIFKPGAVAVTPLAPDDEAGRVVHGRATALGLRIVRVDAGEAATIEKTNVAIAGAVLDALGEMDVRGADGALVGARHLDEKASAAARLKGRMERMIVQAEGAPLPIVLDGAHVPFNLAAVLDDLTRDLSLAGPCVAVVALASDKDARGFLMELKRRAAIAVFTALPSSSRGRSPSELAAIADSLDLANAAEADPQDAFRRALGSARVSRGWLLVTGSLYLVGALRGTALAMRP